MSRSNNPPERGPSLIHPCPLHAGAGLLAEHASWRMHLAMRGREFPDTAALQRFIDANQRGVFDDLPDDAEPADRAQDLFYRASACDSWIESSLYLEEAEACDPTNVDVKMANALRQGDLRERVRRLEALAADSEKHLREVLEDIDEVKGDAWGLLEARPALRARAALVHAFVATGRVDAAIEACRSLLAFDPGDRQGARHVLVSLLVEVGDWDEARACLKDWKDDPSSFFSWARVLLAQQTGGHAEALLEQAQACNPYALAALLHPEAFDAESPGAYEIGTEGEAEILAELQWRAWHLRPEALSWLRGHGEPESVPAELRTPTWAAIVEGDEEQLRDGLVAFLDPTDEDVFRRLVAYVEEGPIEEEWHVSENALQLLERLGLASRAVPQLVAYLERVARLLDAPESAVLPCLKAAGEAAVAPLLAAHDRAANERERDHLLSGLVATKVRDDEIYRRLVAFLDEDLFVGTGLLIDYGDPRAIPLFSVRLDAADPALESTPPSTVADLIDAILELGGALTEAQKERFASFLESRARNETPEGRRERLRGLRAALQDMDVEEDERQGAISPFANEFPAGGWDLPPSSGPWGEPGGRALERRDLPGRNEPCWCGSGKKYKRCHWAEDEAGRRH
jgi:tetratricopeptide (TPR) repeat protein